MPVVKGNDHAGDSGLLNDPSARALVAGDLEAVFLPSHGMLGISFRHRGGELLRRVRDLEAAARGAPPRSRSFTRGRTAWRARAIAPPGGRWCSICHRHSCTSTSTGFRCTACRGPCSLGS